MRDLDTPIPPLIIQLKLLDPLVDLIDIVFEPYTLELNDEQLGDFFSDAGFLLQHEMLVLLPGFVVLDDQWGVLEGEVERVIGVDIDVGFFADEPVQHKTIE